MYLVAYRHDLGRLAKPFRDLTSAREWWSVYEHLGLVGAEIERPAGRFMEGTRNLLLLLASVAVYSAPFLHPLSLPWYYLCAVQAAASERRPRAQPGAQP